MFPAARRCRVGLGAVAYFDEIAPKSSMRFQTWAATSFLSEVAGVSQQRGCHVPDSRVAESARVGGDVAAFAVSSQVQKRDVDRCGFGDRQVCAACC